MIKGNFLCGEVIELGLRRARMLAITKFGLDKSDLLTMWNESVVEIHKLHFETDKHQLYEPRAIVSSRNFKFGASGGSYDALTQILTITMNKPATAKDEGKVITYFDLNAAEMTGFVGIIQQFIPGTPTKYLIAPSVYTPNIINVGNVTVGDWLVGDVIRLLPPNEIMSPENINIYDVTNSINVEMVSYEQFNYRTMISKFRNGNTRWARFMQSQIDMISGAEAPSLGTLRISAHWVPPRNTDLNQRVFLSDQRVSEAEERFFLRLLAIRDGAPIPQVDNTRTELAMTALQDAQTKEALNEVQ